ncbi:MAG TPA: MopE-related protein [Polyangia bacterium]|jgi:hypothetical protein|nr:MopE-related protein [Polyangia bacterium]
MKWWLAPVLGLLILVCARPAVARPEGIAAQGCFGCHRGGQTPTVTIAPDTNTVALGQTIALVITVSATNGPTAGFYLRSSGKGTFSNIAGEGTRTNADGITHSAPKRAVVNNQTTFRVGWTAPATGAGGVNFDVWALSGSGGDGSNGDGGGEAYVSFTYGCSGQNYYPDGDNDGFGSKVLPYVRDCTKPNFRTLDNTDCNDYEAKIHPGQPEICNGKDDNCDGQIDEGLPIMTVYEDKDGDGYGGVGATKTTMFCGATKGFGVGTNDCNDDDPAINPGASEVCNGRDDNCNQRVDEEAKVYCGVGWCRRAGDGCGSAICTPGKPRAEMCNAFDDDCDGVIDNGVDLCGKGQFCQEGYCLPGNAPVRPDGGLPIIDGDGGIVPSASPSGAGGSDPGASGGTGGCSVGAATGSAAGLAGCVLALALLSASRRQRRRR